MRVMRDTMPRIDQTDAGWMLARIQELEQRLAEAEQALQQVDALKEQSEMMERLFNQVPVMVVLYDPALKSFRLNQAVGRILGYTNADLAQPGFDLMERVYPDPEYRAYVSQYMETPKEGWLDLECTASDGSKVETSWSNIRLSAEARIGIGVDTRERRLAEQALRNSNERFRVALSATALTVFNVDAKLRYTWVYNNPRDAHGDPLMRLGKRDDELASPEDVAELMALKRSVFESGSPARREITVQVDGEPRIFDVAVEPMRNVYGRIVGLTGAALELTRQRQAQKEALHNQMQMEMQRRLMEHREQERVQIARDLHDGPLQEMIAMYYTIRAAGESP